MTRIDLLLRGVKFNNSKARAAVMTDDRIILDSANQELFVWYKKITHIRARKKSTSRKVVRAEMIER